MSSIASRVSGQGAPPWQSPVSPSGWTSPAAINPQWLLSKSNTYLPDPITSKNPLIPADRPLDDWTCLDNWLLNLHTLAVTTPKTILKGLRGDRDFNFADFQLLSKIPYYVGGLFLVLSQVAPRNPQATLKTAAGVGAYYLGLQWTDAAINQLYKIRNGIPLDLRYRSADGRVQLALASADFPRTDLLSDAQYRNMCRKMGIPETVADPKNACNEQIRHAIVASRTLKLMEGNLLAALGAGYLAKHAGWDHFVGPKGIGATFKESLTILNDRHWGSGLNRMKVVANLWLALLSPLWRVKFASYDVSNPGTRRLALAALFGSVFLCVAHVFSVLQRKAYEPMMLSPVSNRDMRGFQGFVPASRLQRRKMIEGGMQT